MREAYASLALFKNLTDFADFVKMNAGKES